MKKLLISLGITFNFILGYSQAPDISSSQPGLVGLWKFENQANLLQATVGNDLVMGGTPAVWNQVAGPSANDAAIATTRYSHFICNHGIEANGNGGARVNKYSLLIDFKVSDLTQWRSFLQTNFGNGTDGDLFVRRAAGTLGVASLTYSYSAVKPNEWYRMVFNVDSGNKINIYIDGSLWNVGNIDTIDGRFSLDTNGVLLFADENGEDYPMDVANVAVFNRPLSENEIFDLGGYGHLPDVPVSSSDRMDPYLQSPTPNSMCISWHSSNLNSTVVNFGTDVNNLNQTATGSYEAIDGNTNYIWHTVKLTNLTPDTEYFYQCQSGDKSTETFAFRTPAEKTATGQHIRFVVLGDSRTDVAKTTTHIKAIKSKLEELYGPDLHNHIDLIANVGDIVTNGNSIAQYKNEYFTPYAPLTNVIPSMISIGNHESNSAKYYGYMKYEPFTDNYPAPHPYNEKFYQFQLGSAQFLFLNANTAYRISDQIAWLDDRLRDSEADSSVDFIFSFTHQPGHSEIWPSGNSSFVYNDIHGLLNKFYKCAIHFSGHSHNYERGTIEMDNSDPALQHDMREMLSGGAGSALDRWGMYANQKDYPEVNKSLDIYTWTLIDIDVDAKTYTCKAFSFGNNDVPVNNELVDEFYRKILQPRPEKPAATGIVKGQTLVASPMIGEDKAYTCHFQITSFPGIYVSPNLEIKQDVENWYGDSGAPNYIPTNLNKDLDIKRYTIKPEDGLVSGTTYGYRARYRDHNLEWSEWSDEKTFVYEPSNDSDTVEFSANTTTADPSTKIGFSDLSTIEAVSWQWDFNNDGVVDSQLQDPTFSYDAPGLYSVKLKVNNGTEDFEILKTDYINIGDAPLGLDTIDVDEAQFNVYPNPFKKSSKIKFDLGHQTNLTVDVIDINGRKVETIAEKITSNGAEELTWHTSLPTGIYFVRITGNQLQGVQKVIIE